MANKRRCERWLDTFLQWTLPVSEAPESLLIWTGLFCLAAMLKRKLTFAKEYTKQYTIYPNLYAIFVGPPGVVRKSTSAGYGQDLLMEVSKGLPVTNPEFIRLGPTSGSHVKILDKLAESPDSALAIISGEFGNIVSTTPEQTYDFLSKMFDSDKTAEFYEHSTRGAGDTRTTLPSLNLLGCTTPDWMTENTGYLIGGGLGARTIFIFENKARARHLFYKGIGPTVEELNKLREDLVYDLRHIGRLKGEFKPESEALAKRMDDWYTSYADCTPEKGTETFQARKHIHAIRTAMLLSVSESDDLIVTEEHFDASLVLIEHVESRLSRGLSSVGRNPYSGFLYEILDYIQMSGSVKRSKIVSRFWADLQVEEVMKILEILKVAGEITWDSTTDLYKIREKR